MRMASLVLAAILFSSMFLIGTTASVKEYDPWYDFDDDGDIDIFDIVDIAGRYGTTGTPINKTALLYNVNNTFTELLDLVDNLNASQLELLDKINCLNATVTTLEAQSAEMQTELATLQTRMAQMNGNIVELQSRVEALETQGLKYVEIFPIYHDRVADQKVWLDWDLSGSLPSDALYIEVLVKQYDASIVGIRKNGSSVNRRFQYSSGTVIFYTMTVELDLNNVVETYYEYTDGSSPPDFWLVGYWMEG